MHPLLADWMTWLRAQEFTWASEFRLLGGRAMALACNDPFIAALCRAHIIGTLGPIGLRSSSLYDDTPGDTATTDSARALRRMINAVTSGSWSGTDIDAEGVRSRMDLEEALCWLAFVVGDGIAIRIWRKGRSCWRLIPGERVANPAGQTNDSTLRDGFTIGDDGAVDGIFVHRGLVGLYGQSVSDKPEWIPWYGPDGTPNVIHRVGYRLPGMFRGVSRLAPMVVMSRQLNGVVESHVASKRLQAIHGMIVEAESPEEYQQAMATGDALNPYTFRVKGPLNIWVKAQGQVVEFPKTEFGGDDLAAYLTICYKVQCAAVQYPVDVVLCQMGNASLSSARAGLDQFDRTCQSDQEKHISECTAVMDRVEIMGALARGELRLTTTVWREIGAAKYARPPKYSTDRLKDANTISALMAAGVSGTTAFEAAGMSWEDEQEMKRAEAEFAAEHGAQPAPADPAVDPAAGPNPAPPKPAARTWRSLFSFRRSTRAAA